MLQVRCINIWKPLKRIATQPLLFIEQDLLDYSQDRAWNIFIAKVLRCAAIVTFPAAQDVRFAALSNRAHIGQRATSMSFL
jgi:hypothetical protein